MNPGPAEVNPGAGWAAVNMPCMVPPMVRSVEWVADDEACYKQFMAWWPLQRPGYGDANSYMVEES